MTTDTKHSTGGLVYANNGGWSASNGVLRLNSLKGINR